MNQAGAPDEPWSALDERALAYFRFSDFLFAAGLAVLSLGAFLGFLITSSLGDLGWLVLLPLVGCVSYLISCAAASMRYRRWQWRLTPWSVETRSGVLSRKSRALPRSRFVYLEIHAGPVRRRFGLSRIELYTSGSRQGAVVIPAATAEHVDALRSALEVF